jgi:hypothetical protein
MIAQTVVWLGGQKGGRIESCPSIHRALTFNTLGDQEQRTKRHGESQDK